MTGKLLKVEPGPEGDRSAANHPEQKYPRWKMTLLQDNGFEISALTGRPDIVRRAESLIGQQVFIARGGKAGIVGAIRTRAEVAA